MITTTEHQKVDLENEDLDFMVLKNRINYDTSKFIPSSVNLIRYEFESNPDSYRDGFYSYFRIGAEWLDKEQTHALVVEPKIKGIDFVEMFMTCLQDNRFADDFSSVYDIDFEAKPIESKVLNSILSPLLVLHFLVNVKSIVTKGLRKGFIRRTEVVPKVKGRVNLRKTVQCALLGHSERVQCDFEEYSVDNPENRLLKRALIVSRNMLSIMEYHKSYLDLSAMCNYCLNAFENVSIDGLVKIQDLKANKLYPEYAEATRLARMILRRQGSSAVKDKAELLDKVPVFRIDMALLFEHYVLAQLRKVFGETAILYQVKGFRGRYIVDFLVKCDELKVIVDAKYVNPESGVVAKSEYIKQLSGYGRDKVILEVMGYDICNEDSLPNVPCLIIYPSVKDEKISKEVIFSRPVRNIVKFYTCPIGIPISKN